MEPSPALDTIHVKKFHENDWQDFRAIRLEALRIEPGNFGQKFDEACAFPQEKWQSYVRGTDNYFIGIYEGPKIFGMGAAMLWSQALMPIEAAKDWRSDEKIFFITGYYFSPAYRGKGHSKLLGKATIGWAVKELKASRVLTAIRRNNRASEGAAMALHFTPFESAPHEWPDGSSEDVVLWQLDIPKWAAHYG